jgi:hypothetical protein
VASKPGLDGGPRPRFVKPMLSTGLVDHGPSLVGEANILKKVYFTPSTIGVDYLTLSTMKSYAVFRRCFLLQYHRYCCSNRGLATVPPLSFSFWFISAESLKNHSKSQKNHEMENLILLDSTWVDLHSEYIIWYALIQQNWSPNYRKNRSKSTAKTLY